MSPSERAAVDQAHRQFREPTATPKPRAGEHTKGPWHMASALDYFVIKSASGMVARTLGAMPIDEDHARRIVACVNACEGIPTASLELGDTKQWIKEEIALRAERDLLRERERELVEFAKSVRDWYENAGNSDPDQKSPGSLELWSAAKTLVAKARL